VTLGNKQRIFTLCISQLITYAYAQGYELTFGDAFRDSRVHGEFGDKQSYSHASSNHKLRLAVDFNLFKNGEYLTADDDYLELGLYWETLHPLARWGGHFNDGNHFSFEHNGIK
jgi:hypothetical protein